MREGDRVRLGRGVGLVGRSRGQGHGCDEAEGAENGGASGANVHRGLLEAATWGEFTRLLGVELRAWGPSQ
ncbi:hypothetical protein SFR_0442 [Streptomyces sp. FR-008]|nr:hypothetical protein SFR_0442 [Streptomyces sp. FR-008]